MNYFKINIFFNIIILYNFIINLFNNYCLYLLYKMFYLIFYLLHSSKASSKTSGVCEP